MDHPAPTHARFGSAELAQTCRRLLTVGIGGFGLFRLLGLIARWKDSSLGDARWGDDALIVTRAARQSLNRVYAPRPYQADSLTGYINPPHLAQLLSPLRLFPSAWGGPLVAASNVLCLVFASIMVWTYTRWERDADPWRSMLTACTAASPAMFAALSNGAVVVIIVAGYGLLAFGHRRAAATPQGATSIGADLMFAAGVLVLTLKPQHAVLPMAVLIALRRWRAVGAASVAVCGAVGVSVAAGGVAPWTEFMHQLSAYAGSGDAWLDAWREQAPTRFMPNARGLAFHLFGFGNTDAINVAGTGLLAAAVVAVLMGGYRRRTDGFALTSDRTTRLWCAGLLLGTFVGQHVNLQDLAWMAWLPVFATTRRTAIFCGRISTAVFAGSLLDVAGWSPGLPAVSLVMVGLAAWAFAEVLAESTPVAITIAATRKARA